MLISNITFTLYNNSNKAIITTQWIVEVILHSQEVTWLGPPPSLPERRAPARLPCRCTHTDLYLRKRAGRNVAHIQLQLIARRDHL